MADNKSYLSNDTIDKVIFSGEVTINSGTSTTFNTSTNQFGLPLGIYSTDGDASWSDCESASNLSPHRGSTIFASLRCSAAGVVRIASTTVDGASAGVSTHVKFVLLALDNAPAKISNPVFGSRPGAYSSDSSPAYRKINQSGDLSGVNDGAGRTVVLSPTGFPAANHWASNVTGLGVTDLTLLPGFFRVTGGAFAPPVGVYYDGPNMQFGTPAGGNFDRWIYRTYKETN